jgi:hypothetical protein
MRSKAGSGGQPRHNLDAIMATTLGVVLPVVVIVVAALLVALLPDDGWTLTWNDRSKFFIHSWGR